MTLAQFGGVLKKISLAALVATALLLSIAPLASASGSGQISGTVTELLAPQNPIAGIEVCAFPSNFEEEFSFERFGCEYTNSRGEYVISRLPVGNYHVEFSSKPESEPGYITQYWHDTNSSRQATTVVVAGGTVTGINEYSKKAQRSREK